MKPVYRGENGYIYETEAEAAEADRLQAEKEARIERPRRLDTLFAEKVLNLKKHPVPDPDTRPVYMRSKEPLFTYSARIDEETGETWESLDKAKGYTNSLDLVVNSLKEIRPGLFAYLGADVRGTKQIARGACRMEGSYDTHEHEEADIPLAMALTIACLKAVGCTDEELA